MKNLKIESVFKCILLFSICLYINKLLSFILVEILLLIKNRREFILFSLLIIFVYLTNSIINKIPLIGIVEYTNNSYSIVNAGIYKVRLLNTDLAVGTIGIFKDFKYISDNEYFLINNIKFDTNNYRVIYVSKLKSFIFDLIYSDSNIVKDLLVKTIYGANNIDSKIELFNYSSCIYFLMRKLKNNYPIISIIFILVYSLTFGFDFKLILLTIEIVCYSLKIKSMSIYTIELFLICLINPFLFKNYSYIIIILYRINNIIDLKINGIILTSLLSSMLFYEINLVKVLLFKQYVFLKSFTFIILLISTFIPIFRNFVLFLNNLISYFDNFPLSIRGCLSLIGILIFIFLINITKVKNKYLVLLLYIVILCPLNHPFASISYIDVGQGDSILIRDSLNKTNILLDTGSKYNYSKLRKYLYKFGIYKLDYLIISHDDEDHNGNINKLCNDFKIDEIISVGKDININNINLKYMNIGSFDNDNDNSLIYEISINNVNFLFTGDISKNVEPILLKKFGPINCDVLKVSHHGSISSTSEKLISELLPKYAIISTNGKYNHPSNDVLNTLDKYMVNYLITKNEGTIEFIFTKYLNFIKTKLRFIIGI